MRSRRRIVPRRRNDRIDLSVYTSTDVVRPGIRAKIVLLRHVSNDSDLYCVMS